MAAEPAHEDMHSNDIHSHARDYSSFLTMLKWGAIISFVTAMIVLIIISN